MTKAIKDKAGGNPYWNEEGATLLPWTAPSLIDATALTSYVRGFFVAHGLTFPQL